MKMDYLKSIGFTLNLVGENYGVSTTGSSATVQDRKLQFLRDWQTLASTSSYDHYYRLLEKVDTTSTSSTSFAPAIASTQHLVYGNAFNSNWAPSGQSKLNLANNFTFTSESYYERISTGSGVVANQNNQYGWDRWWAEQRARTALSIEGALYWGATINGQNTTTLKEFMGTTVTSTTGQAYGWHNGSIGYYPVPVYYAVAVAVGKTKDRVKLTSAQNNGVYTPSAIVIPSQKKIYYFIYNYQDNPLNEA
jgi:hypothetical protein